ncbi:hypothetical protein V6Z12_D12G017300 [Gossypium hirsutum]
MVNGGLGIRQLQDQNELFLTKLGFNLILNTEALWVQVLRNKYSIFGLIPENIKRKNCFYLWRSLIGIWEKVKKGLIWIARDGCLVNFWNDEWVREVGPLK